MGALASYFKRFYFWLYAWKTPYSSTEHPDEGIYPNCKQRMMHSTGKQKKRGHLTGKNTFLRKERYTHASAHFFCPGAPGPGRRLLSRSSPRARGAAPLLPKKSPRLEKENKRLKSHAFWGTRLREAPLPAQPRCSPPVPPPRARTTFPSLPRGRRGLAALLTARRGEAGPGRPRWRRGCWAPGWTWRPSPRPSRPSRRCAPAWRGSSTAWRMGCGTRRPWRVVRRASWPPSRRACTPSAATWGEHPALRGLPPPPRRCAAGPPDPALALRGRCGRERSPGGGPPPPGPVPLGGARRCRFHSRGKF